MRKILLATAAIIGGTNLPVHAQAPANPSQGQYAAPYGAGPATNNNNNAWGIANTPSGSAAAGPLSTLYAPNTNAAPAPGTIVIRLNGRVEVDVSANYTSADTGTTATGAPNGYKLNPVGVGSYMRLYPAFDGLSANGIRYGAAFELRENFGSGNNINNYPGNSASGGAISTTTPTSTYSTAASPSANSSAQTVFVRRAFAYLASDQVGIVRLGQGDGVLGLFDNCIFTAQCWDAGITSINGGALQQEDATGPTAIPFAWLNQSGAEYGNNKIVYLSPQFYGFDFGAQYAPSEGNAFQNTAGGNALSPGLCTEASQNCISDSAGQDATRWLNQVGVGLRYQQVFGPVDFKAYGFYETAGKENLDGVAYGIVPGAANVINGGVGYQPILTAAGRPTNLSTAAFRYDNLSFYKGGIAVTASNLTASFDYIGGAVNGALAMRPTGGAPENAELAGLTYINGAWTFGGEVGIIDSQGDARLTGVSQRHEYEVAFGGNYKLAPGIQLVGEYMYTYRHQGGYDFNQGALGNAGAGAGTVTRDAQGRGFMFSTVLTW